MSKIGMLFFGILSIIFGITRLFDRILRDPNLSPIDMGPYHWVIGIIFIVGGLYFVYNAIKLIIRDKRKDRIVFRKFRASDADKSSSR